jgi:hypothetical protein
MNPLLELRGQPGQTFGGFLVPGSGKTLFTLKGNRLSIETKLSWDLEKKRTVVRVKAISVVELNEGRYWILLVLGILLIPIFVGIIPIIAFFFMKQRSLLVYANGLAWVVFYKPRDQELAENLALSLLQVADQ